MEHYCEWIYGYTERVHRTKQHASSIRTIPSKISPLFRFSFSTRVSQYNIAQCCYWKFRTQISSALFLTV